MKCSESHKQAPFYLRLGYTAVMAAIYICTGGYFLIVSFWQANFNTIMPSWAMQICGLILIFYGIYRIIRFLNYRKKGSSDIPNTPGSDQ